MEQAPLMEVRSVSIGTGTPARLKAFEDAVWVHQLNSPVNVRQQRVLYGQIAQVWTQRRMLFSTLVIETRGGDTLKVTALSHGAAKMAAEFIEQRLRYSAPSTPLEEGQPGPASTLAQKLRDLAELKEVGLITPEEYEAKRRDLLDRM